MRYFYAPPAMDLRAYVGAYYIMDMPLGGADLVRVEIPHVRFLLRGDSVLEHNGVQVCYRSPCVLLCGPAMQAGAVSVTPGTLILGAPLTPRGWQALVGAPVHELASGKTSLEHFRSVDARAVQDRLLSAPSDAAMFAAADDVLRGLVRYPARRVHEAFLDAASEWLLDTASPSIDVLKHETDFSSRQLDRLCKTYFGASPVRLRRKYRALHVSNALAWSGETDWRKAAGAAYYDQAHFIKEFKEMIGCTPGEYIKGRNMMIRFTLMQRLAIEHSSGFSLIG